MPALHQHTLVKIFQEDRKNLEQTAIPVVTLAGTFQEDIKQWHGLKNTNATSDVVFSRAHFSMAYGVVHSIWGTTIQPQKTWMVDPTNYVGSKKWKSITFTESVGKLLARQPILKAIKDVIDTYGRNKLPILESITPPLLYLFEDVHRPILSFHIAAGNILAKMGKTVVQVITDPHVRSDYLQHADLDTMYFCVFDERTKLDAIEKAAIMKIDLDPERVIVTGPPIDHRIVQARRGKKAPHLRPIRVVITTGGLGTNKGEIKTILEQLLPTLKKKSTRFQVMVYCGTQADIYDMTLSLAKAHRIKAQVVSSTSRISGIDSRFSVIYHPQIFDANELLIKHAFPWADVFISKPSGDMAYDAVASGAALLTLKSWGVWENHIAEIFRQKDISRVAEVDHIVQQLTTLANPHLTGKSWLEQAMKNAQRIDPLFVNGTKEIVKVMKNLNTSKKR